MRKIIAVFLPFLLLLISCKTKFYTEADFVSVPKIDVHAHLNSENNFFEEQAIKDNFRLLTINVDHSDSAAVKEQLRYSLMALRSFPGKVFYSATFFFDTTGWIDDNWSDKVIEQLKENIAGGAVSVKLWKNIGMTVTDRKGTFIMADDPKLDPVYKFIIGKNLPVTGHLGEPKNCWLPLSEMTVRGDSSYFANNPQYHMFLHPEYPSYEDQINARDRILEKFPDLKFIGCHLGSQEWNVDELSRTLDRFPNMAVDLAARICHLQYQSSTDRKKIRDFCIKYQDRILYGTDLADNGGKNFEREAMSIHNTWIEDWRYFATDIQMKNDAFQGTFEGLQLPKEVVRKIFSDNAINWYKLPVN
jgi:predicted TIM-barrel fold metal-dependent hydrolase